MGQSNAYRRADTRDLVIKGVRTVGNQRYGIHIDGQRCGGHALHFGRPRAQQISRPAIAAQAREGAEPGPRQDRGDPERARVRARRGTSRFRPPLLDQRAQMHRFERGLIAEHEERR